MKKARFITFEGCDGCGKSTQIQLLADQLRSLGHLVFTTREPGGTPIGEAIRRLLVERGPDIPCFEAETLLFSASRAQLVHDVLRPQLARNDFVLCDRFVDSTVVYQGFGRHLSLPHIQSTIEFAIGDLNPDLTILLDISEDLIRRRVRERISAVIDRLESETIEFYKDIRRGYLSLADRYPERIAIVDGAETREEIARRVLELVQKRLHFG